MKKFLFWTVAILGFPMTTIPMMIWLVVREQRRTRELLQQRGEK